MIGKPNGINRSEGAKKLAKPSARLRDEIARLQEQLKQAETKEAERIGRVALRAGLGDIEIADSDLMKAFEDLAVRFRKSGPSKAPTPVAPSSGTAAD